jgi:hypothetical protein
LGLEHGFDVARAPAGRGALRFELSASGDVSPRLEGSRVRLGGLRYGGLRVTDVRGRLLRSRLRVAAGRIVIGVDDRGARYPLRVDPFVQQAKLTASDGGDNDQLGGAVAAAGNTVVAGAENHNAAYVFVMPSGGWPETATETAELRASDGAQGDGS